MDEIFGKVGMLMWMLFFASCVIFGVLKKQNYYPFFPLVVTFSWDFYFGFISIKETDLPILICSRIWFVEDCLMSIILFLYGHFRRKDDPFFDRSKMIFLFTIFVGLTLAFFDAFTKWSEDLDGKVTLFVVMTFISAGFYYDMDYTLTREEKPKEKSFFPELVIGWIHFLANLMILTHLFMRMYVLKILDFKDPKPKLLLTLQCFTVILDFMFLHRIYSRDNGKKKKKKKRKSL